MGLWTGATADTPTNPSAAGEITLSLAVTSAKASSLTVECEKNAQDTGVTLEAINGSLVAVQTSENT